jgi:RNA-directed DNA polymerase
MTERFAYLSVDREMKYYSLIDKVAQADNLRDAWARVKSNHGAPGVDGVTVERFEGHLEEHLAELQRVFLNGTYRPSPVRRVWIPKADGKQRPLGIPTVRDRVAQQAALNVLEECFERTFLPCSYGYRRGVSAIDALDRISALYEQGYRHVVDADIRGCFDHIEHEKLVEVVHQKVVDGSVLNLVRGWLKSGVLEGGVLHDTEEGTPQGGVISPLLCNIYLSVFDEGMRRRGYEVVRYADDFVVLTRTGEEAEAAREAAEEELEELGLEVNRDKTKVTTFGKGFDFLGYRFYKHHRSPSPRSRERFKEKVRSLTVRHWTHQPAGIMIRGLNRLVIGWCNYFKHGKVTKLFAALDGWTATRVRAYLEGRKSRWAILRIPKAELTRLGLVRLEECARWGAHRSGVPP